MTWLQTHSGRAFDLLGLNPSDVLFDDIAHALANIPRYNGHTTKFYSVAEHCVRVAEAMPAFKIYGLLHDAHEAYIGDITTPVVLALDELRPETKALIETLKTKVDKTIWAAAGLPCPPATASMLIKWADIAVLQTERAALLRPAPKPWVDLAENTPPADIKIKCWSPNKAKTRWLDALSKLTVPTN